MWGVKGTREFQKRSRNGKNSNRVLSPVTLWEHLTRTWPLPGRDSLEQEEGEISRSGLGMVSIYMHYLCIYSHLETYTVLVKKVKRQNFFLKIMDSILKWFKSTFYYFFLPIPGLAQLFWTGPGISSCSCSRLSLPSRSPFLVSYSSHEQDHSKYPASL